MKTYYSLLQHNTFGFDVKAHYYFEINQFSDFALLLADPIFQSNPKLILSGGSNILFTQPVFEGVVASINHKGIEIIAENDHEVILRCQTGEYWKDLVNYCVAHNWYGLENLSGIPGKVGAAPVQNIGAYGSEAKDCIDRVHVINIKNGDTCSFSNSECHFAYRQSIFKQELKNRYIIFAVDFRLQKQGTLKLEYGNIRNYLINNNITSPSLQQLSQVVSAIRDAKLPDVEKIGNAGSFFKNPIVGHEKYLDMLKKYPSMPSYPESENKHKIPAGWLIEQAGWKGYRENHVGVYDKQALVLVHYGGGSGNEIKALSEKIQESIKLKFGIEIDTEVNFI